VFDIDIDKLHKMSMSELFDLMGQLGLSTAGLEDRASALDKLMSDATTVDIVE